MSDSITYTVMELSEQQTEISNEKWDESHLLFFPFSFR